VTFGVLTWFVVNGLKESCE